MHPSSTPCRSCSEPGVAPVLSLGRTPLANGLVDPERAAPADLLYPLTLGLCRACGLVQLLETVPSRELFSHYLYFSSFSDTVVAHGRELAERFIRERRLGPQSLALEIASNDGYLLQHFAARGVPVLGIEPARNIAAAAEARGVPTRCAFFGRALARALRRDGVRPSVIFANNVLAHAEDLNDFVAGLAELLPDDATAEIEFPYVRDLIDHCEFDTIYHEHRCYFSLTSIEPLLERHGLRVVDAQRIALHGGSLHLSVAHKGARRPDGAVAALLLEEQEWGAAEPERYEDFAQRVEALRSDLRGLLRELRRERRRIAAYGAAAKGVTLLSYCGLSAKDIEYVVDRSPHKQGRLLPGSRIPICGPERLIADRPDYVLLLSWNFADEIMRQQSAYLAGGGRFIVPVPHVHVVTGVREAATV